MSAMPLASPVRDRDLPPTARDTTDTHAGHPVAPEQQPVWADPARAAAVRAELATRPGLVAYEEIQMLRLLMAEAAQGTYQIIQAGDCAEDPADSTPHAVNRKIGLIDALAGIMKINTGLPVIRIGRIAGQYAKPRSNPTETIDGQELPVYRGHLVNSPNPTHTDRRADPDRMLTCYQAAHHITTHLRQRTATWMPPTGAPVWTSHEALILDYERPLLRHTPTGHTYLSSTHLPWIGERTRHPNGSHVNLLAQITNPIACKIGPTTQPDELLQLCNRLDPHHQPGRLTLIARMGINHITTKLPPLVQAVHQAGHPVNWLCDPMHGNTIKTPTGQKTRNVETLIQEITAFQHATTTNGGTPAGLHLETTPDNVTECIWNTHHTHTTTHHNTTLCDPRLNPQQAITLTTHWTTHP